MDKKYDKNEFVKLNKHKGRIIKVKVEINRKKKEKQNCVKIGI